MKGKGRGWLTAEYSMLPGSTSPRKKRERGANMDGRTTEIQRLIGRSLRAIIDLAAIGERTVTIDCDVLEADGGTRTLSITGAFIALVDALQAVAKDLPSGTRPLRDSIAAVSVGIVAGKPLLDLSYEEDVAAEVDMNVVMTGSGRFVEVQGTGEEATFSEKELSAMLDLARGGIRELTAIHAKALGPRVDVGWRRFPRLTFLTLAIRLTQYVNCHICYRECRIRACAAVAYGGRLGRHAGRASFWPCEI